MDVDVARVAADVGGEDGEAAEGGETDDALAELDVALADDALAVAGGEAVLELVGTLVPEEDGEHLEVDDAAEEGADALEQIVGVEDGGDFAGDVLEDGEGVGLALDAGVEAGVFDGIGHAGGDEFEQAAVVGGEEGDGFGLEVEDADDLVFDDEGNGELGADGGIGVDVVFDAGDVVDEERAALGGGLAGDAAAELDADALDVVGVAGLEAHPELLGAVVEQEDGEDAVIDDGANEIGDAMHEGVEVEGGVERVGEAEEEVELDGSGGWREGDFDVGIGGVLMEENAARLRVFRAAGFGGLLGHASVSGGDGGERLAGELLEDANAG